MSTNRINLIGLSLAELEQIVAQAGEPAYRSAQIADWIYTRGVRTFESMTNLPKQLQQKLSEGYSIYVPIADKEQVASDGTRKFLLTLADGENIEAVAIPQGARLTACISSQVGCAVGCAFCATGKAGFTRNLDAGEIVGQVIALQDILGKHFSNIVLMGMGEPLLNYDNVMRAIRVINHPAGLGLGARHITISTCGIVPGIRQLAAEELQINLAVSLHAANDAVRVQMVPINSKYPIKDILAACRYYIAETNRRVTFEYVLQHKINDSAEMAHELGKLLHGMLCHVNLIPINPTDGEVNMRPAEEDTRAFARIVQRYGVETTVRKEKGTAIAAACGQLRQRHR